MNSQVVFNTRTGQRRRRILVSSGGYYGQSCYNYGYAYECNWLCCRLLFSIVTIFAGVIITAVGHSRKPFWDESDDWCDFCREDRPETERINGILTKAGPALIGVGVVLLIMVLLYNSLKKKQNTVQRDSLRENQTQVGNVQNPIMANYSALQQTPANVNYGHQTLIVRTQPSAPPLTDHQMEHAFASYHPTVFNTPLGPPPPYAR